MKRLMAFDIAFANVGYVVFEYDGGRWNPVDAGVVSTKKKSGKKSAVRAADDNFERCRVLYRTLMNLIQENDVAAMVAELPSGGSKSSAAAAAMARGAAVFACVAEHSGVVIECTTPRDGKLALCGRENASKYDMMKQAESEFPCLSKWFKRHNKHKDILENKFEHAADAVGAFKASSGGVAHQLIIQLSQAER